MTPEDDVRELRKALEAGTSTAFYSICEPDRIRRILDRLEAAERDAARYRWLRDQHWSTSPLCVVADPKDAVKLGRTCPSGEYLDLEVDAAMKGQP